MTTYRGTPLRLLEVWKSQIGSKSMRRHDVSIEGLNDWLEQKLQPIAIASRDSFSRQHSTLLLICCNFGATSKASGYNTHPIKQICDTFDLHWTTLEAFTNNNGAFARYFSDDPATDMLAKMYLTVRVPHFVTGSYGLSLVFDSKTATTRALLYGYTDDEYKALIEYLDNKTSLSFFQTPLLLASYLLQSYRENAEAYRAKIDSCIYRTEMSLGYAVPGSFLHDCATAPAGRMDFDRFVRKLHSSHDDFMRQLHSCQTELGALTHVGNFGRELGVFLHKTSEELDKKVSAAPTVDADIVAAKEYIVHQIEFQTNLWWSMLSQMSVLKDRTQTHINLIFSLIAQDENRLSRSVAQKSEMIAAASKKDSAAMKTLAVLTTVFLPPTFVATFFSMTMFDWTSDPTRTLTSSKYLWIYWAVAVPLTALVLITWRIWWDLEEKKYQKELRKKI